MSALKIKELTKVYRNGFQALKGINLEVSEGDFFALLGANGAGKSTTIGIITSLVNKTSGEVSVFGHSLDKEPQLVKSCIGLVPQEFNCNIFEKCQQILINQAGFYGIAPKIAKEKAQYYLQEVGLYEQRLNTPRELSGGMKRRLMIARALMHSPKMLILDEPTAGVDIEIRHSMWEFLTKLNQEGTTVILTTHYLEEAEKLCRNIAIIDGGTIVKNSSMEDILQNAPNQTLVADLVHPIQDIPNFKQFVAKKTEEKQIELYLDKPLDLNTVFEELNEHGLLIRRISDKRNRLEDLFLNLIRKTS